MHWYLFALLSPLLWAITNHIDKYVLSRYVKNAEPGVLAILTGFVGLLFAIGVFIFVPSNFLGINVFHAILIILNGALFVASFIPYYYALNDEDTSLVIPLFQTIPIFSFVLGFIFFKETITLMQVFAGILIIIGATLISIDFGKAKLAFRWRMVLLMLLSSLMISIHYLVFKFVAISESFWITVFWEYLGAVLVAVFLLVFTRKYRRQFIALIKNNSAFAIVLEMINNGIDIVSKVIANYATILVPVVVVNLANGMQSMFALSLIHI